MLLRTLGKSFSCARQQGISTYAVYLTALAVLFSNVIAQHKALGLVSGCMEPEGVELLSSKSSAGQRPLQPLPSGAVRVHSLPLDVLSSSLLSGLVHSFSQQLPSWSTGCPFVHV